MLSCFCLLSRCRHLRVIAFNYFDIFIFWWYYMHIFWLKASLAVRHGLLTCRRAWPAMSLSLRLSAANFTLGRPHKAAWPSHTKLWRNTLSSRLSSLPLLFIRPVKNTHSSLSVTRSWPHIRVKMPAGASIGFLRPALPRPHTGRPHCSLRFDILHFFDELSREYYSHTFWLFSRYFAALCWCRTFSLQYLRLFHYY